jgi:hypothetical protein
MKAGEQYKRSEKRKAMNKWGILDCGVWWGRQIIEEVWEEKQVRDGDARNVAHLLCEVNLSSLNHSHANASTASFQTGSILQRWLSSGMLRRVVS